MAGLGDGIENLIVAQVDANQGVPETIEGLFQILESPLLNYAMRLTQDFNTAQDLVQEAFLRLHSQFDQVRERRAWLYRTVHNLALNQQRNRHRVVSLDAPTDSAPNLGTEVADAQPLPDELIARWEHIGQVRLCLENLDERSRELLRLKFHEELSYQQISTRTGLTTGHVGYLLHHALKNVAAELARTGVIP